MKVTTHRCKNCLQEYFYYLSGKPNTNFNDEQYCPECKKAIVEALKTIKPKFKLSWVNLNCNQDDIKNYLDTFQKIKIAQNKKYSRVINVYRLFCGKPNYSYEMYYWNGGKYLVETKDDNTVVNIKQYCYVSETDNSITIPYIKQDRVDGFELVDNFTINTPNYLNEHIASPLPKPSGLFFYQDIKF